MAIIINTPAGNFVAPSFISDPIEAMSDIELLKALYAPDNEFVNPFAFREIQKRQRNRVLGRDKQWSLPNSINYKRDVDKILADYAEVANLC